MSDSFQVTAQNAKILDKSHLVEEMKHCARGMEMFPVLIGDFVAYFHNIEGGYSENEGYHVVNLIHEVQGPDSPPDTIESDKMEAHLDGVYVSLDVNTVWEFGDYPDEDYTLSLQVEDYQSGPYSFSDDLQQEVDKRETEHEWEG